MKQRNYLILILAGLLVMGAWRYWDLKQDLMWLCVATGPHDVETSKLRTDRGFVAKRCVRHGLLGIVLEDGKLKRLDWQQ